MLTIFIEYDLKITNIYKSKDNSEAEFLGTLQDQVFTRGVPTKRVVDNTLM